MANKRLSYAAKYFAKVAALNAQIDKGGSEAKDAALAKNNLSTLSTNNKNIINNKKTDLLDSKKMLPGSYGTGKRRG